MLGTIREFSYLTAQKTSVYRQIMRFFYLEHLSQRSTIPPESVLESLLEAGEVGYDLEQCLIDLDALVEWGNLGRRRDQRRVASLTEYSRRRDLYYGSARGLSIEGFLEGGLDANEDAVTVSAGVVVGIEERLKMLEALLEEDTALEEIELLWREVHRYFLDLSGDARMLSANLERKLSLDDLDDFLDFKDVVKGYVERLARELSGAGRRIRSILEAIPEYRSQRLFEAVTKVRSGLMTQTAGVVGASKARNLVQREFNAMNDWFARAAREGDGLEYAIETLRSAISKVLAFVDAIHRTRELGLGRAGELATLAENLASLEDAIEARDQLGRYVHLFAALHPIGEIPEEPVSRRQFEELIAKQGGRVVEGGDYEELVRKTVFAGANETNFRDLIELLLTVRGAKLGREVKPSVIETLLRRSLPQVSHDVVEQLSSGIEGIDRHADTVKRIESQLEAAREIARAHFERALSNAQFEFARERTAKVRDLEARTARDTARVQLSEFRLRLEDVQTQDTNVKLEQEGVQAEADVLTSQLEDAEGALLRTESDLENVRREVKRVGDALRRGNEWLERSNLETVQLSASKIQNQQHLELTLEGLSKLSWWNALDPDSSLAGRNESLGFAQNAVRDFERDTERLRDRELEERRAFDQTQAAKESLEARTFEFENVMRETAQSLAQEALQMFPLEKPQLEAYQDALEVTLEPLEAAITLEPMIQPFIVEARGLLEERRDVRRNLETKLKTYQDQLQHLESQTEVAPKLPIDRAKASAALEAAGIAHRAFFECIKPKPNTKNLAQLEAGLLESGLLTALIVTAKDRPRALDVLNTEKLADALLMPGEAASQNLSTLLEPESDALNETHQMLQSISLERANSQASVSDTHWANGLLTGSASTTASEARFIGVVARTQERARQLEVLRKQISDLEQELESSTHLERQAFDDLTRLETAWTKLREARLEAGERRTAQNARERARDAFQTRVETHERALVQLETARDHAKTAVAKLEESFLSLGIALENSLTDEFEASPRERLNKAQLEFQNAQNNQRQIVVFKASIEQILARLEAVATEQNDRRGELETSSFERAQLETKRDVLSEQLEMMRKEFETPDRADQRTRLNKAKARLSTLRREHEELLTKLIEARGQIKLLEERLPELERNANNRLGELERAEQKLQDAKNVHPKLASLVLESKLGNEALETQRREREIDLDREFHLHKHTLETPESFQPILTPTGVRFTLEGASTQPDELLEHFSQNLEEAVRLLSDEEARVFHDELISTLAEELDTRIREAREWVRGVRVTLKTLAFHDERLDLELEARQTDGLARLLDGKKDPSYQPETWRSSLREELRNIDMANAYATFAAQGERAEWHVVAEVKGANGGTRYKADTSTEQAFDEDVMADLSYALQQVVQSGTGTEAGERWLKKESSAPSS